jgi:hypothetical protein
MINKLKTATTTILGLVGLTMVMPGTVLAQSDSWVEKFKFKGDFRYRYEYIDEEDKSSRGRNRIRLRLGVHAKVNDTVDFGAMFGTGGEDPVSTNQTLDSQASTKDIRLDQGYFTWKPASGVTIKGGKFKNPFYKPVKSELLWDADIRPEGMVFQYDNAQVFINAGFFPIEERSKEDDSFMFAGQAGYKAKINDIKLTLGSGYFGYTEMEGRKSTDFGYLKAEDGDSFGNTLDDEGRFMTDYKEWEFFGDVTVKAGGMPIAFFVDYVVNTAADDNDTGYTTGFKIGKAKAPNTWDFRYQYKKVEADAVFGTFSDSDFIGGGTDGKGHEVNFGYQIAKGWKFAFSYFINTKGLDDGHDYNRMMLDLKFKF